jgi:predicted DNA-binding protein (MmcQ/YjbR family)
MPRTALHPRSLEGKLRAWALAYPGVTEEFPWGERAFKVGGKVFLFLGRNGQAASFSMKLPRSAAEALELGYVEPTHYGLGKHGWVTATVETDREAPLELFQAWLEESFRAVAPKKVIAEMDGVSTPKAKRVPKAKSKSKTKRR